MTEYEHRPNAFAEVIGQEELKARLRLAVESSMIADRLLPSILLVGPPGSGKSSIARLVAGLAILPFQEFVAPLDQRILAAAVESGQGILLIDEIHGLTKRQQEYLLPVLEDNYVMDRFGGKLEVGVSIIGATTEPHRIIMPLYDRFRIKPIFDPYTHEEMTEIVRQMARKMSMERDDEWCALLAAATLGVPRNARSLVHCAREVYDVTGNIPSAQEVLQRTRTTHTGLSIEHIRYLETMLAAGGAAGLNTMRQLLGMPATHIENLEIDLIRQGLIFRASSGRELTNTARRFLRTMEEAQ